jgi:hypothetical protein
LREASASEPLLKCRKRIRRCQNRGLSEQRCQVQRDGNQLTNARCAPRMIEQGFALCAPQRTRDFALLFFCEDVDFNHRSGNRHTERLTPRANDHRELREVAAQSLDFGRRPPSRIGIQLIPAIQRQNEPPMMGEQHVMLLPYPLECGTASNGLQQGFRLRGPFAERHEQGNGPPFGEDSVGDLEERCRLAGARRRDKRNLVERSNRGR